VLAATALLLPLAACGAEKAASGPPSVTVTLAGQQVDVRPTQYCTDGQLQRYTVTPKVIAAAAGTRVSITVPADVAAQGWRVDVYDDQLRTRIGTVDAGTARTFDRITTSDPEPPGFYLVVTERAGKGCQGLAGAWPVGVIRGNAGAGTPSSGAPSSGTPSSSG
jgi:hypothetical protein